MAFVIAWYALASVVTFMAFAVDKHAARRGGRRIPESRLHLLELAGGFPGGLLGQHLLRHKRRQTGFRLMLGAIALAHASAWCAWLLA
jgi:uncharacterized membrane protein YsdA (DUF1294 family)